MLTEKETARMEQLRQRYTVLSECLTIILALQRRMSRNEANQEAKPGYEKPFEEEQKRAGVIREIMQEYRDEMSILKKKEYNIK